MRTAALPGPVRDPVETALAIGRVGRRATSDDDDVGARALRPAEGAETDRSFAGPRKPSAVEGLGRRRFRGTTQVEDEGTGLLVPRRPWSIQLRERNARCPRRGPANFTQESSAATRPSRQISNLSTDQAGRWRHGRTSLDPMAIDLRASCDCRWSGCSPR